MKGGDGRRPAAKGEISPWTPFQEPEAGETR
jgi:hypothetical protein